MCTILHWTPGNEALKFWCYMYIFEGLPWWLFPGKEPTCNAEDAGDVGSIPGSGISPGGGNSTHFSIPAWEIPWTEEPGGHSPWGRKESDMTDHKYLKRQGLFPREEIQVITRGNAFL